MKYSVTVVENVDRNCVITVDAESEEEAVEKAEEMWDDGEIENDMEVCGAGEQFVAAYIDKN